LYPGSSFSRTIASVEFLKILKQVDDINVDATASLQIPSLVSLSEMDSLILCSQITFDTVATNRQDLFKYIQQANIRIENSDHLERTDLMKRLGYLLVSQRAADSDIAASLSQLILNQYVKNCDAILHFDTNMKDLITIDPLEYYLDQHLELFENHIQKAEKDLVLASHHYPLNGIILVLSGLIQDIDLSDPRWNSFVSKLTNLCIRSCDLTEPVCADASPEGNVPDEYVNNSSRQKVAQILLRHCFRTIKNATYCFVEILRKLKFNPTLEQLTYVKNLGDLMTRLLTSVRHKGAFSSVQENFGLLCKLLSNSKQYSQIPKEWLQYFLSQIDNMQVSVTRRSAGLPAAILAILVSPSNDVERSQLFKIVIERCYDVILNEGVERDQQLDLPQVHALNVLK
jgi:hypothetical protein